jgi:ribosomal-protein-alanine N-acetyltransferase
VTAEQITIRRLAFADLPHVIAVERRAFPTPWSLAMFVLELSKPTGVCLAATIGNELAGYLICARYDDVWHLMNVAVDPSCRRRGVGSRLLDAMLDRAGHGQDRYTLEVRTSNKGAIELYERFGFTVAGTRRRYYQDTGEDALIMWRVPAERARPGDPSGAAGDAPRGASGEVRGAASA